MKFGGEGNRREGLVGRSFISHEDGEKTSLRIAWEGKENLAIQTR